ncbi:hypothetical protein C6990_03565 [Nitrosopumilus sp. b3]|uniref:hypothetical protein n=1 Tax=Nitrosopumilus sp. b3 TaxID=2109909 RepID=UPI0015F3925E|nr:hypothetical protein [Nitrosopumilus sp. b3]KAF6247543.1 hypothetical protein C6990_03565 [Nitrosopumilus sp. b3]
MTKLSLEDIEFIKILANSDASILQQGMNDATRLRLERQVGVILREYYHENTMDTQTHWNEIFLKAGISEDDGKSAIACARRLGIDIS